jgi:2-polyprenyl-3-methyl-5-hydroxy-6-metoxy-1,4-benzoquinol methylase
MTEYPVNRRCPLTGEAASRVLGYAPASVVAAANPTYRQNYAEILGISPDDEFPFVESPSGFVYAGWLPPDDFLRHVYEDVIDHSRTVTTTIPYRQALLEFGSALFRIVALRRKDSAPLRLLDFGCGYGALLQILTSRDIISVGYEPSAERGKHTIADGRFPLLTTVDELKAAGPIDLFVCTEVLEHVPNPREVLRLLKEVAAPSALLAVTVPQCDPPAVAEAFATFAAEGRLFGVFNPWEHLNYFSSASLHRMMAEEGFEVVRDYGAAAAAREALARIGEPAPIKDRLRNAARLFKRTLVAPPSTQLFLRSV